MHQRVFVMLAACLLVCTVTLNGMYFASAPSAPPLTNPSEATRMEELDRQRRDLPGPPPNTRRAEHLAPAERPSTWTRALERIRASGSPYVIVDARNGLGNRLRALASGMAVAKSLHRPVMLVWVPDAHVNCSITSIFASPLPFELVEEPVPFTPCSD